jgi:hypothetical protein
MRDLCKNSLKIWGNAFFLILYARMVLSPWLTTEGKTRELKRET